MHFNLEKFIDPAAEAVGLAIPAQSRASLVASFERLAAAAEEVMEFPLDSDIEISQVFVP